MQVGVQGLMISADTGGNEVFVFFQLFLSLLGLIMFFRVVC
jgi:hypothetical protein